MIARNRLARALAAWLLAVYWRLRLRYRTMKLRALMWVLRRLMAWGERLSRPE
ncbi:MAG: hypothetical protein ACLQFI_14215 [Methylocella sp.]|jgi:hypothetical protein